MCRGRHRRTSQAINDGTAIASTQLSTQLTTPKEKSGLTREKKLKKLIYIPNPLVNSQDVF